MERSETRPDFFKQNFPYDVPEFSICSQQFRSTQFYWEQLKVMPSQPIHQM